MKVSFNGISEQVVTFYDDGAEKGKVCKVSSSGGVKTCSSGERFMGIVINCDGSFAEVQTEGCVTVGYSGTTAPSVGYVNLASDANGNVMVPGSGGFGYLVLEVNSNDKVVTIYL